MNPILKRKAIRKIWKKIPIEEQDKKITHYAEIFRTMLGLEVNKEKEDWIDNCFLMIMTQREENHYELLKAAEYALRYKRRRDPTLFIDSVLFPNLDQAGSIVRFMMYYLGKELMSSIGVWDLYEDPSLAVSEKAKEQPDKKTKKKPAKKKKPPKNGDKNQRQTAGTTENEDTESQEEVKKITNKVRTAFTDLNLEEEIAKMKWETLIDAGDEAWIPVDEKKKKAYLQKNSQNASSKEGARPKAHISDSENKKTMSSKKKKKKSISETRSVNGERGLEEKRLEDIDPMNVQNRLEMRDSMADDASVHEKNIVGSPTAHKLPLQSQQQKLVVEFNQLSDSLKSESNLELRSSVASLESESNGPFADQLPQAMADLKEVTVGNTISTKSSKLRAPAKSKPFVHLEMNTTASITGLLEPFFSNVSANLKNIEPKAPNKLQTRLLSTMSEGDKKFYDYLNKDIEALLEDMELHASRIRRSFTCVHERIKRVIHKSFEGVAGLNPVIYGSYATNLLLSCSDMDICIFGFKELNRMQAQDVLQTLTDNLALFGWCPEVKHISGATVPVIKIVGASHPGSRPYSGLQRPPGRQEVG